MKKLLSIFLSLILVLSISACGRPKKTLREEDFGIVTSFYPVYVATINITEGADKVEVVNLIEPSVGCLHNYLLTQEDMELLSKADVFVASGLDMESFVGKSSLGMPELEIIDSGEDVPISIREKKVYNPHYWLSIENAIAQSDKIARNLIRNNPENEKVYTKNLEEYKAKLTALLKEAEEKRAALEGKRIVVIGDAFDYLGKELGIEVVKVLAGHRFVKLSNEDVLKVVDYIKSEKVGTLVVENNFKDEAALRSIQKQTGCRIEKLDILTGGSHSGNDNDSYINAMRYNLGIIERVAVK